MILTMRTFGILVVTFTVLLDKCQTYPSVTLSPSNNTREVEINPGTTLMIEISELSSSAIGFGVIEVHSYFVDVTISYNESLSSGYYTKGTNIGLVIFASEQGGAASQFVYLTNDNNTPHEIAHVLLILQTYDSNAPIPGGCNMEESIRTAPFLPTQFTSSLVAVEIPLASWPLNVRPASCDKTPQQYDIYQLYLPENDKSRRAMFDAILSMSGVNRAETNGRKIEFSGSPPSKVKLANYKGTGRVVVIVARALTSSAAYVPTVSFGCNPRSNSTENFTETCDSLGSTWTKLIVACLFLLGLFHTLFGHRFYKTHLFIHGFLATGVMTYIIVMAVTEIDSTVVHVSIIGLGGLGGLMLLLIWCRFDVPVFAVFLGSLLAGFIFSSIVAYTPLADYAIMKNDAEFWLAFSSLILIVPIVLIPFTHSASIICTALVGSCLSIITLDLFVGSNLRFIMFNVFHRATDDGFRTAVLDPTFQTADLILTLVWGFLVLAGILFQIWREKGRPPFPSRPAWFDSRPSSGSSVVTLIPEPNYPQPTEDTPLLLNFNDNP